MDKCKSCVVNADKCCDECVNYSDCKERMNFGHLPADYPGCWVCAGKKGDGCVW